MFKPHPTLQLTTKHKMLFPTESVIIEALRNELFNCPTLNGVTECLDLL